jgi:RNA polymerase sigma-70 factor (ECF subfamily)
MGRYALGDEAAFNVLYERHSPRLRRFLAQLTRDAALTEDLVQATFERMHRFRHSHKAGEPVFPWLLVIARHCYFDERRGPHARCERLTAKGTLPELPPCSAPCRGPLPPEIAAALESLPANQRDAFLLTKVLGYSGDQVSPLSLPGRPPRPST